MSTLSSPIPKPQPERQPPRERIPPLCNGDRLTRDEFERRYDATPNLKRAELIEGRVYVPPPVSHVGHGEPHFWVMAWLTPYAVATPGITGGDNGSLRLDLDNMPQPDAYLMIRPERGGQAKIGVDGYVEGAPDVVVEVAASSASYDLHDKLRVYRRNGVREYIVWLTFDRAIDYFVLRGTEFVRHNPAGQGQYRSEALPGLWLDANPMTSGDIVAVLAYLQSGLSSLEHAAFVQKLAAAAPPASA
jgi:Uma2 family endonuclease